MSAIRNLAPGMLLAVLAACSQAPEPVAVTAAPAAQPVRPAPPPVQPAAAMVAPTALPMVVVHKSASCGCCASWVERVREAGFAVEVHDEDDLGPVKQRVGIPPGKGSCHTAVVGGYFIEGHVPPADIKRLLVERPDAQGLVLPGMPAGSPGMETPDGRAQPYTVELVQRDGSTTPFARH
jgi:hypothetical protein